MKNARNMKPMSARNAADWISELILDLADVAEISRESHQMINPNISQAPRTTAQG